MTTTEHQLRELLDQDSADGHYRGVTVADVNRRVRGIRRGRMRVLGALAAGAAVVIAVATLPSATAVAPQDDVWTGALAQPTPDELTRAIENGVYVDRVHKTFTKGGKAETFTFTGTGRKTAITVVCRQPGSYALAWVNGKLQVSHPCDDTHRRTLPVGTLSAGETNTVVAAIVPAPPGGPDAAAADEAVARATPYDAGWSVLVSTEEFIRCDEQIVIVDPASGRQIHSTQCKDIHPDITQPIG